MSIWLSQSDHINLTMSIWLRQSDHVLSIIFKSIALLYFVQNIFEPNLIFQVSIFVMTLYKKHEWGGKVFEKNNVVFKAKYEVRTFWWLYSLKRSLGACSRGQVFIITLSIAQRAKLAKWTNIWEFSKEEGNSNNVPYLVVNTELCSALWRNYPVTRL